MLFPISCILAHKAPLNYSMSVVLAEFRKPAPNRVIYG
jgi:hypothetical protein